MTTEELELLELAAKAAGIEVRRGDGWQSDMLFRRFRNPFGIVTGVQWNPRDDDGDAFRLAVALRMEVGSWKSGAAAVVSIDGFADVIEAHYGEDPERAARLAIVRAAAEIGKGMA